MRTASFQTASPACPVGAGLPAALQLGEAGARSTGSAGAAGRGSRHLVEKSFSETPCPEEGEHSTVSLSWRSQSSSLGLSVSRLLPA